MPFDSEITGTMLTLILLVFSFVFFTLSTFGVPSHPRFNLVSAGLALWVLSILLGGIAAAGHLNLH